MTRKASLRGRRDAASFKQTRGEQIFAHIPPNLFAELTNCSKKIFSQCVVIICYITYSIIMIPLQLGFLIDLNHHVTRYYIGWIFADWGLDFILLGIEIWRIQKRKYVAEFERIADSFNSATEMRGSDIKPIVDFDIWQLVVESTRFERNCKFFAIVPIDFLYCCISHGVLRQPPSIHLVYLFRLPKLGRFLLMPKYVKQLELSYCRLYNQVPNHLDHDSTQHINHSSPRVGMRRQMCLFGSLILCSHWFGCLLTYVAHFECGQNLEGCHESMCWAVADQQKKTSLYRRYIRSIYYAIVTLVTTGYGDIVPISSWETVIVMVMMGVGMFISTSIIAGFSRLFCNRNARSDRFNRMVDDMQWYMKHYDLDVDLCRRINVFFSYCWAVQRGVNENEILNALPSHLRNEVIDSIQGRIVTNAVLFRECDNKLAQELALKMESILYSPGDIILEDLVSPYQLQEMFLLLHGKIAVLQRPEYFNQDHIPENDNFVQNYLVNDGETFGEWGILNPENVVATSIQPLHRHRALTFCQVLSLSRENFNHVISRVLDPAKEESTREKLIERIQHLDETRAPMHKFFGSMRKTSKRGFLQSFDASSSPIFSSFKTLNDYPTAFWNTVCLIGIIFQLFEIPFQIGFRQYREFGIIDRVLDGIYLLDFYLRSRHLPIDLSNSLHCFTIRNPVLIWRHYRQSKWLTIDLLSSIPLDVITITIGIRTPVCMSLRCLHLLRTLRISNYANHIFKVLQTHRIAFRSSSITLFSLSLAMVVLVHMGGCLWFYLGSPVTATGEVLYQESTFQTIPEYQECLADSRCTWLTLDGIANSEITLWIHYLRAIYWSLITTTTIGYGDIRPISTNETLFAFMWVLASSLIQYACIGAVTTALAQRNRRSTLFDRKTTLLNRFFHLQDLPLELRQKAQELLHHEWQKERGIDENDLLNFLPVQLKQEIGWIRHRCLFQNNYLFQDISMECLRQLGTEFQHQLLLRGDIIIRSGALADRLVCVIDGTLVALYLTTDKRTVPIEIIDEGMNYGSQYLQIRNTISQMDIVASSHFCHVAVLYQSDYDRISTKFEADCRQLKQRARDFDDQQTLRFQQITANFKRYKLQQLVLSSSIDLSFGADPSSKLLFSLKRLLWNFLLILEILWLLWWIPYHLAIPTSFQRSNMYCILLFDATFLLDRLFTFTHGLQSSWWLLPLPELLIFGIVQDPGHALWWKLCAIRLGGVQELEYRYQILYHSVGIRWNEMRLQALRLFRIIIILAFTAHCCGMFYYSISASTSSSLGVGFGHATSSWQQNELGQDQGHVFKAWLRSNYVALSTLTIVCYGDITPSNSWETIAAIGIVVLGVGVLSVLLNLIAELVHFLLAENAEMQEKFEAFGQYASQMQLTRPFQHKVMQFYAFLYCQTKGFDITNFSKQFPTSLQPQIAQTLYHKCLETPLRQLFSQLRFNQCFTKIQMNGLILTLPAIFEARIYLPKDLILREGEAGDELFVLKQGKVDVCVSRDLIVVATMHANEKSCGNLFGEIGFFGHSSLQPRIASIRTLTYCEVLVTTKAKWDKIVLHQKQLVDEYLQCQLQRYSYAHQQIFANLQNIWQHSTPHESSRPRFGKLYRLLDMQRFFTPSAPRTMSQSSSHRRASSPFMKKSKLVHPVVVPLAEKSFRRTSSLSSSAARSSKSEMTGFFRNALCLLSPWHQSRCPRHRHFLRIGAAEDSGEAGNIEYFYFLWTIVYCMMTMYNLIMVPFRIAFEETDTLEDLTSWKSAWTVLDAFADMILIADIGLHAIGLFQFSSQQSFDYLHSTQQSRYQIDPIYLRTKFKYDLCISLPLAWGLPKSSSYSSSVYRINRLFGVMFMPHLIAEFDKYVIEYGRMQMHLSTLRILRMLWTIYLLAHWIGCLWFIAGYYHFKSYPQSSSWVSTPGMLNPSSLMTINSTLLSRKYIRSLYFAAASLSTVGYGDIASTNNLETCLSCGIVLLSAVMFAALTGAIERCFEEHDKKAVHYENIKNCFNIFSQARNLSPELRARILKYYDFEAKQLRYVEDQLEQLLALPASLRQEMIVFINKEIVFRIQAFDRFPLSVKYALASKLRRQIFFPHYQIIQQGSIGHELFYLYTGYCKVYDNEQKFEKVIHQGQYFGERAIFDSKSIRLANVEAITQCQIYVLSKQDYDLALAKHPSIKDQTEDEWLRTHISSSVTSRPTRKCAHSSKSNRRLSLPFRPLTTSHE